MSEEAIKQTFNPIPENDYHAGILSTMKTRSRRGVYLRYAFCIERKTKSGKTFYYDVENNHVDAHYVANTIKNENPSDLVQIIFESQFLYTSPVIHTADGKKSDNVLRLDFPDHDNEFPNMKFIGVQLTRTGFLILAKYKDQFRRFPVEMPGEDRRAQIKEFLANPVKATFDKYVEIYHKFNGHLIGLQAQPSYVSASMAA